MTFLSNTGESRLLELGATKIRRGVFPSGKPKISGLIKCSDCDKARWVFSQNTYRNNFSNRCRGCDAKIKNTKHGLIDHPLYTVWGMMKHRCVCKTGDSWKYYGSRGIAVCESWQRFLPFYEWAVVGWKPGLLLDREDNSKGYCPENCRWLTSQKSAINRCTTKLSEADVRQIRARWEAGEMQKDIAADFGIARNHVSNVVNFECWKLT